MIKSFCVPSGIARGVDRLWIIGDKFAAKTYQQYFRDMGKTPVQVNVIENFYSIENFEVSGFFNATCHNSSAIGRVINSLVAAFNKYVELPKIIAVVLDDDVIKNNPIVNHKKMLVREFYTRLIKYMCNMTRRMIKSIKEKLPKKALKNEDWPYVMWIVPPEHTNFENNRLRQIFGNVMEQEVRCFDKMYALRLKQVWHKDDPALVSTDTHEFLPEGHRQYWQAVDRSIRFADFKFCNRATVLPGSSGDYRSTNILHRTEEDNRIYWIANRGSTFPRRPSYGGYKK